ncbi:MAG: threonine ammonia-lyase [Peptococcaceae bacterium]|nr:threonine ammonia-lyase [Peptococcaceae bacterium]
MNLDTTNHLENVRKAAANLDGVLRSTELIYSDFFSKETGNRIYIKPENLQRTGSFKIRGAFNKVANLTEEERAKGIIASSAGNHAQGVALAASKMGIKATIVMPQVTPLIKIDSTKSYGANVVLHGNVYDEAYGKAVELAEENGYTFVHPYNDYDVMCGQGTIALEILEELEDIDQILVPVGGGGLISGIALAAKSIKPTIQVIGVEPVGAASMTAALDAGQVVTLPKVQTAAEGVAVKTVGDLCLEVCSKYVDGIIQVTEEEIMEALLLLLERHKIICEAAGALPLAAIKKLNTRNKNIACVVSGGNIDMVTISSTINSGLVTRGRVLCFTVDLPDTPGQLLSIAQILSSHRANVIKLEHNQFKALDRVQNVQLEVTAETNGHEHIKAVIDALEAGGFKVNRIY